MNNGQMDRGNENPIQHLPWWLRKTTKKPKSTWSTPGFERGTSRMRASCVIREPPRSVMIGISGSLIWSKTLMELIFSPCGEFRWKPEGPVSQIHSPHLHVVASGIFSDLLRSVQVLKREWGAGSYRTYSIPGKTAALVPEFAVEDLPLGRTAA